ncbi:MAG: hypothetical protein RIC14_16715 [Filomicrobium sp.]
MRYRLAAQGGDPWVRWRERCGACRIGGKLDTPFSDVGGIDAGFAARFG